MIIHADHVETLRKMHAARIGAVGIIQRRERRALEAALEFLDPGKPTPGKRQ